MEYAKDIILNVGYKKVGKLKHKLISTKLRIKILKDLFTYLFNIVGNWTSQILNTIRKNRFISLSLGLLLVLISADFILINNFMKILSTLY